MTSMFDRDPVVLVSHSDPVTRLGIAAALDRSRIDPGVVQCTPADSRYDFNVDRARVVVADYEQGLQLCAELEAAQSRKGPHVLVVTHRAGEHDIRTAVSAGVKGYLLPGFQIEELVTAIHAVWSGQRHLSSEAAVKMIDSLSRESLTPRETDVLQCLVDGCANKRISLRLDISVGTVKSHVRAIFSKLGVASRTEAVCMAGKLGVLASPLPAGKPEVALAPAASPRAGCAEQMGQAAVLAVSTLRNAGQVVRLETGTPARTQGSYAV